MIESLRRHYELYPYPCYPLLASVRRCDTYALNLEALWARFNGMLPPADDRRILIAGCGSFSPYPFAVANPRTSITALDLSRSSLRRARLHCLLHGHRNVEYRCDDLLDSGAVTGRFGLIDVYGVLHHLPDPLAGLQALAARLVPGGILRIMVYSRYARREEESIRRAFRLLKIRDVEAARRLMARARPGSRLRRFMDSSPEARFRAGVADSLLHPSVVTYRIDELMDLVRQSGLQPLLFAHPGALDDPEEELQRLRTMEEAGEAPGNFVLYLRAGQPPLTAGGQTWLTLNPCLAPCLSPFRLRTPQLPGRLGHPAPPLDRPTRRFLARFRRPVPWQQLSADQQRSAEVYRQALFLLQYRA